MEAIERTNEHQPDVILIDNELTECSGIETIRRINERLPNTNIIVLAHSEADADLISAVKAGARAYISKNISLEDLIKIITLVTDGEVIIFSPMAPRLLTEFSLLGDCEHATGLGVGSLLSKREQEVLSLVSQGLTNSEIATSLFISLHTVKVHVRNIMGKFNAHTRQHAVVLAREKAAI